MEIVFLGTGAAGGTPGVGKSKRFESSVLIKSWSNILIDVTRDFTKQTKPIDRLDAILITHGHKDACGGLSLLKEPIPIYAHKNVADGAKFKLGSFRISALEVPHAKDPRFPTFAWKLKDRKTIVYASDIARITEKFKKFCQGADVLIIDGAMWKRKIFTHITISEVLPKICKWEVGKIILTQIGKSAPPHEKFGEEIKKICKRAIPAYDGLVYHI